MAGPEQPGQRLDGIGYEYTDQQDTVLGANEDYWVVFGSTAGSWSPLPGDSIAIALGDDNDFVGIGTASIAFQYATSYDAGQKWTLTENTYSTLFAVEVSAVPEPANAALFVQLLLVGWLCRRSHR